MNFPPENFEQLRQVVLSLKQGKVDLPIGKKSLAALVSMVEEPDIVALNNIVELAKLTHFSAASITRLAKLLGFQGFHQFQLLFKQKSKLPNNFYSEGVKRLIAANDKKPQGLLTQQLAMANDSISQCVTNIDEGSLNQAKILIARQKRVFVFGYRQSSAIANIFRYGLALIRHNVQMLDQAEHGVALAVAQLKSDDLLVLIGSSPYSNVTLKIAALAKKQGCQIIAITDSELSPLNDFSNVAFHIPAAGSYYTNSLVANCFFVESLLSITAVELGQTAINNLQQHERLLGKLEVSD